MTRSILSFNLGSTDAAILPTLTRLSALALLVSLIIAKNLYAGHHRLFVATPLLAGVPMQPSWVEWLVYALALACLVGRIVKPASRWTTWPVMAILCLWTILDLERVQAYLCLYLFVLVVITIWNNPLPALRLTMSSFYFWSGFQKLNLTFVGVTFPWFVQPLTGSDPDKWLQLAVFMAALGVPLFEIAIGVFLFFPRWRRTGVHMAVVVCVTALVCLGPLGRDWNAIVWPLNLYVVAVDYLLFYQFQDAGFGGSLVHDRSSWTALVVITLSPCLATLGLVPSFPAFKLYSGNIANAHIIFSEAEQLNRLPIGLGPLVRPDRHLSLLDWTMLEFHTSVFPDPAVFRHGARGLCPYLSDPDGAILRIYQVGAPWREFQDFTDAPLCTSQPICLPGDPG